jgi:hypothetical protein
MKKIIKLTLIVSLAVFGGYVFFEPQLMSGEWGDLFISSANAATSTGATAVSLTVTGEINLNCSSSVSLLPTISGQTGGTATGTFGCVVTTNNSSGYNLSIKKDQTLRIADVADQRFDDYATSSGTGYGDWNWVAVVAGDERFGFTVNSCASTTDIVQNYRDNGSSACGTSTSVSAWHCFTPLPTNPALESIANRATPTPAAGILTTFGLQAQAGGSNNLQQGTYNCTTTVTAATNP